MIMHPHLDASSFLNPPGLMIKCAVDTVFVFERGNLDMSVIRTWPAEVSCGSWASILWLNQWRIPLYPAFFLFEPWN